MAFEGAALAATEDASLGRVFLGESDGVDAIVMLRCIYTTISLRNGEWI